MRMEVIHQPSVPLSSVTSARNLSFRRRLSIHVKKMASRTIQTQKIQNRTGVVLAIMYWNFKDLCLFASNSYSLRLNLRGRPRGRLLTFSVGWSCFVLRNLMQIFRLCPCPCCRCCCALRIFQSTISPFRWGRLLSGSSVGFHATM